MLLTKMTPRRRGSRRGGFTLIEVLLVLVILVILGSMAGVFVRRARQKGLANAARAQIGLFESAIKMFEMDMLAYPSSAQGLQSLRQPPGDAQSSNKWQGPYLEKDIPLDPWDNPYQYELLNQDSYRIWSMGPDRNAGTADDISGT